MKLLGVELRRIAMPLVTPFRTSFGVEAERDVLLVRALTADGRGLGRVRGRRRARSTPRSTSTAPTT